MLPKGLRGLPWRAIGHCAISYAGYFLTNHWRRSHVHMVPASWLDHRIPLQPWTVYAYVSLYPLLGLQLRLWADQPAVLKQLVVAITRANYLATMGFVLYQTTVPRPDYLNVQQPGATLLKKLWQYDQPYNAFPSLHTTYAALISSYMWRYRHSLRYPVIVWCGVIIASTLSTKQHYLYDVIGGLGLAYLVDIECPSKQIS